MYKSTATRTRYQDNMFSIEIIYDRVSWETRDVCININGMNYMDEIEHKVVPYCKFQTFECEIDGDTYTLKCVEGKTDTAELLECVLYKNKERLVEDADYCVEWVKAAYFDPDSDTEEE